MNTFEFNTTEDMEVDDQQSRPRGMYGLDRVISPEIVEISEESLSTNREGKDVYVAVGRDDADVVTWALGNAVYPDSCVYLIHVFPPLSSIPTPVGRLSRSQVSREQFQTYANEENQRRRNVLQKYIRLCTESKVAVDTVLIENDHTAKAILDLIPVLNVTRLVIGTERPLSRRLRRGVGKGEYVRRNAPCFCEVTIVCDGKSIAERQLISPMLNSFSPTSSHRSSKTRTQNTRHNERNFFECCFSGKFA